MGSDEPAGHRLPAGQGCKHERHKRLAAERVWVLDDKAGRRRHNSWCKRDYAPRPWVQARASTS